MGTKRYWFGLTNAVYPKIEVIDVRFDDYDYSEATPATFKSWTLSKGESKRAFLEVYNGANGAGFTLTLRIDGGATFEVTSDPREQVVSNLADRSEIATTAAKGDPLVVYAWLRPGFGDHGGVEYVVTDKLVDPRLPINGDVDETPAEAARVRRFKLRLGGAPGRALGGEWLCRLTGAAKAYQSYCGVQGTPRIFTWYHHRDGRAYLQDQEGNWLSHDAWFDCLYMSTWTNAVAWKIVGGYLIRENDDAVVSFVPHQRWVFSSSKFLQAAPMSADAVTVVEVEEEPDPLELLVPRMVPVYAKRHPPTDGDTLDRYDFTTSERAGGQGPETPARQRYAGHEVAFFGVHGPVEGESTAPIYRLRMSSAEEGRDYYKLSRATQEGPYALAPEEGGAANFHAFDASRERPYLTVIYEHSAENPTSGQSRYCYDSVPEAHSGWSAGTPIFRAISLESAQKALVKSLGAESARRYAEQWIKRHGGQLAELFQGLGKDDIDEGVVQRLQRFFEGLPPAQFYSLGVGLHGGYGVGTAGVEIGSFWSHEEFGKVPIHEPISDYSVEWVTFGGAGVDLGASVDAFAFGAWFGDIDQIEGACNGVTIGLQYGVGISVTLFWDGTWQGAKFGPHPIGLNVVLAAGLEFGVGVFYNASTTQFWNRRPSFPKI